MKALLITTAIAFLMSLYSVAHAATDPVTGQSITILPPQNDPNVQTRAGNAPALPTPEVGSINDEVGTNSLTHPERDGRTAGSINDTDGTEARRQRAMEELNRSRTAE